MKKVTLLAMVSLMFFLIGCETKQQTGVLAGGLLGGLVGSRFGRGGGQVAATAGGAILGALIGGSIGASMDETDKLKMAQTTQRSLESGRSGRSSTWKNPDNGHSGSVTPKAAYQDNDGRYCREYQQTVTVGGKTEQAYGTACRKPDGAWQVVS